MECHDLPARPLGQLIFAWPPRRLLMPALGVRVASGGLDTRVYTWRARHVPRDWMAEDLQEALKDVGISDLGDFTGWVRFLGCFGLSLLMIVASWLWRCKLARSPLMLSEQRQAESLWTSGRCDCNPRPPGGHHMLLRLRWLRQRRALMLWRPRLKPSRRGATLMQPEVALLRRER